jgi:hypothetical protein
MPQQFEEQATDYDYQQRYDYSYGLLDVAIAQVAATSASRTAITDADLIQSAVEWRLVVDGDEIDELYDVAPVVDTANPFGDFAVLKMDDAGGQLFDRFGRGTRVEVDTSTNFGLSYETRFTGFVVERRELEQAGADKLEIEAYSFDQFLRKNTVTNDQSGKTITAALQDIVTTDTPVSFVSGNVTVGNPQTVTESLRGRKVEQVLQGLAFASTGEEFGVNDDLEFFFRPPETRHIERGIDNTQWFNFDIPELGKDAINEVEVFFAGGSESVVVDRGKSKLDVQNELGLPEPATERKELNRDDIDTFEGAKQAGEQFLRFRNTVLTGTITTFDLFDAEPGDTIDVTVDPRGIDDEFRIAEVEYRWGRDETVITIVEKRSQDQSTDILRVSEKVDRIEQRGADRDGVQNRVTNTDVAATITPSADVDGVAADRARLTNDGRNLVRDAYTGDSVPAIDDIAVGDDASNLSRSNTDVESELSRASVATGGSGTTATFSASLTASGVTEVGLFAAQTLVCRLTLDAPVDVSGTVTVTLETDNDDSVDRGVITTTGQAVVRDILASDSPALPTQYAYGRGQSAPAETDTALDDRAASLSLGDIVVQTADTTSEFSNVIETDLTQTRGVTVANGQIQTQQSLVLDTSPTTTSAFTRSGGDFASSNAEGQQYQALLGDLQDVQFKSLSLPFDVPQSDAFVAVRVTLEEGARDNFPSSGPVDLFVEVNGNTVASLIPDNIPSGDEGQFRFITFDADQAYSGNVDIKLELSKAFADASSSAPGWGVDVAAIFDNQFNYNFASTVDSNFRLSGPELFPDLQEVVYKSASTRRPISSVTASESFNDVSNRQFISVSNDGGTTFQRFDNTAEATGAFATSDTSPKAKIGLSRFGSRTTASPTQGFRGQAVSQHELVGGAEGITPSDIGAANVRAIARTGDLSAESDNLTEGGQRDASGNLLSRSIFPAFPIGSQTRVESSEETTFTQE